MLIIRRPFEKSHTQGRKKEPRDAMLYTKVIFFKYFRPGEELERHGGRMKVRMGKNGRRKGVEPCIRKVRKAMR